MSNAPKNPPTMDYADPALLPDGTGFPRTFWIANVSELFERAAFYGMFIALSRYLNTVIGFTDVQANTIGGAFSFMIYFLPPFMGTIADKITFRRAIIIAFSCLTIGYFILGAYPNQFVSLAALACIAFGGAIVKPVILGTASKCSRPENRARAFSIFYFMVNIGAFLGKTFAYPLRVGFTLPMYGRVELGLVYINYYSSLMAFCALLVVVFGYRNPNNAGAGKPLSEVVSGFVRVFTNLRFMTLIVIVAGFWTIQSQLYSSIPQYMTRLIGKGANPEWLANINPFVVVLLVVPITHMVRNLNPVKSIGISLLIIPCSALMIALAPVLKGFTGEQVTFFGWFSLHHVTVMVIIGIALQGLAECFLSPKFMEYASKQAAPGEEGLYMGFQNLPAAIAFFFGFVSSGFLIDAFCPDPNKLKEIAPDQFAQYEAAMSGAGPLPEAYAHAHYIWYFFVGVGVAAFIALMIYNRVTRRLDSLGKAATGA